MRTSVNIFFSLLAIAVLLASATTAQAVWVYDTVASTGDQGQHATIALDGFDQVHVAWYDASNNQLMYSLMTLTGWDTVVVDTDGNVGQWASIAIDPITQNPAIAYYDADDEKPYYAYFDGDNWYSEIIDNQEDDMRGQFIELAFSPAGVPWVSYHYDNGAFHTMGMNAAHRIGAANWDIDRVDYTTSGAGLSHFGQHTTIAFSTAGYPQIAYRDDILDDQKFAWLTASGWSFESGVELFLEDIGEYGDIALDLGDNIYISSWHTFDLSPDGCAALASKVAGDWDWENIECGDYDFGSFTSIAVDSLDHLHMSYYGDGMLQYAYHDGGDWQISTLDDQGDVGQYTGIALNSNDSPYIVYYNATAKDLMLVYDQPLPVVSGIDPSSGPNTEILDDAVVTGNYFLADSLVALIHEDGDFTIDATDVQVLSDDEITCDFDLNGAPVGLYDVQVTTSAGSASLADGFEVITLPPDLTEIDPDTGANNETAFTITLTGLYFTDDLNSFLEMDGQDAVEATSVDVVSETEADAVFNLKDLEIGLWDVKVITTFGNGTLADAFEITCGEPNANFSALPRQGEAPLNVNFFDTSVEYTSCEITDWEWDFGDGETSTETSPDHIYTEDGEYTVSLTVTSAGGANTETKTDYITVGPAADDDVVDDDIADDDIADDDVADDDVADDDFVDDDFIDDDLSDDDTADDDLTPGDDDTMARVDDDDDDSGCGC